MRTLPAAGVSSIACTTGSMESAVPVVLAC